MKKLKSETNDKSILETQDFEKDEIILRKEQEIEDLKKECNRLQKEVELKATEYATLKTTLESSIEDLKGLVSTSNTYNKELEKEAGSLKQKLADFEKDKNEKQEEMMKRIESEGRADGLEKEVATKDAYIKELEDIIVEKDFTLSEMEEKKEKDEADGAEKLDDEKQKTAGHVNELEKRCKKLEEDEMRIEGELNDEVESQRLSIQNLKRQQDELRSKLAATEADLEEARQEKDWKEKMKQQREELEKRVKDCERASEELVVKEEEVRRLETEVKNGLTRQVELEEKLDGLKKDLGTSRDEVKVLKLSGKETAAWDATDFDDLQQKNETLEKEVGRLKPLIEAHQREQAALDVLKDELKSKAKEIGALQEKADYLQANMDAKEYEVKKAKEDRDNLMAHYENIFKQKQQELAAEKQRSGEAVKLKEAIARATPTKRDKEGEELKEVYIDLDFWMLRASL